MRSIVVLALLLLPIAAIAKPPELAPPAPAKATSSAAIAPSSGTALAPLKKLTREQAARLDAALMHAAAIEKAYSDQIAKDEAPFIEEAKEMCKVGGFTLDDLVHKRIAVNFKTGEATRAAPAEPSK